MARFKRPPAPEQPEDISADPSVDEEFQRRVDAIMQRLRLKLIPLPLLAGRHPLAWAWLEVNVRHPATR